MLKALILDFDGVIIDSIDIKTDAFRELFKEFPEHLDAILEYHLEHGGVSRYKKFTYIYENILHQPIEKEKLEKLGYRFSQLVVEKIIKCPIIPGAYEFLKEYSQKLELYIASGTPEGELHMIIDRRGILKYFKGIFGTPALKSEIIGRILKSNGYEEKEVLFVGDSITDYEEARKAGVPFVGFIGDSSNNPFPDYQIPMAYGFKELKKIIDEMLR